jgi:NADPH:quinone reductase
MGRYWSYGEVARVPEHAAAAVPPRLSAVEAAAVWMPYMTAYGALVEYGRVERGEHVVIRAASSSVGVAAIQIALSIGAVPIAVTRGAAKMEFLERHRPAHVIVSDRENLVDRIREITGGRGADMILDPVSGPKVEMLCQALRYQGRLFVYGRLDPRPTPFPVGLGLAKGITVRGYSLFEVVNFPEVFERVKRRVYEGLERGEFQPAIDETFPLSRVADAHRRMESNEQRGKIVVTV